MSPCNILFIESVYIIAMAQISFMLGLVSIFPMDFPMKNPLSPHFPMKNPLVFIISP